MDLPHENLPECTITEAENFMRRTPPTKSNKSQMLENFVLTRKQRSDFVMDKSNSATTILNRYPRLKDNLEMVIVSTVVLYINDIHSTYGLQVENEFNYLTEKTVQTFLNNWVKLESPVLQLSKAKKDSEIDRMLKEIDEAKSSFSKQ